MFGVTVVTPVCQLPLYTQIFPFLTAGSQVFGDLCDETSWLAGDVTESPVVILNTYSLDDISLGKSIDKQLLALNPLTSQLGGFEMLGVPTTSKL